MKARHIYIPLAAGISTHWLVLLALESRYTSVLGRTMFKYMYLPVLESVLATIPFAVLILAVALASAIGIKELRLECVFWGGFIPAWGFSLFYYWLYWYPFYDPARPHISSTSAVALIFIPIRVMMYSAAGLAAGWLVSFLPVFRRAAK